MTSALFTRTDWSGFTCSSWHKMSFFVSCCFRYSLALSSHDQCTYTVLILFFLHLRIAVNHSGRYYIGRSFPRRMSFLPGILFYMGLWGFFTRSSSSGAFLCVLVKYIYSLSKPLLYSPDHQSLRLAPHCGGRSAGSLVPSPIYARGDRLQYSLPGRILQAIAPGVDKGWITIRD